MVTRSLLVLWTCPKSNKPKVTQYFANRNYFTLREEGMETPMLLDPSQKIIGLKLISRKCLFRNVRTRKNEDSSI